MVPSKWMMPMVVASFLTLVRCDPPDDPATSPGVSSPPPADSSGASRLDVPYDGLGFAEEVAVLEPLNAIGTVELDGNLPDHVSEIEDDTRIYTANRNGNAPEAKIIQPKLLADADRAMDYVNRVYDRIEGYAHMFAGKQHEFGNILDSYAMMLEKMLAVKSNLKHLSFVRRYLTHVAKVKSNVTEAEKNRAALVEVASAIYGHISDKYSAIKLDFERHYKQPSAVIDNAVHSLVGIGDAYKKLVKLHYDIYKATEAYRLSLNGMRASSVYMFSYVLCLDILFTEILPLRAGAIQDIWGTKSTGNILGGYSKNIENRRNAIKALLNSAVITDSERGYIEQILQETTFIYERSQKVYKSTESLVRNSGKAAIDALHLKIVRVVEIWEDQYNRPVAMSAKLLDEYEQLKKMAKKIKEGQAAVHSNKQALYTMSSRCDELYVAAKERAGLGKDAKRTIDTRPNGGAPQPAASGHEGPGPDAQGTPSDWNGGASHEAASPPYPRAGSPDGRYDIYDRVGSPYGDRDGTSSLNSSSSQDKVDDHVYEEMNMGPQPATSAPMLPPKTRRGSDQASQPDGDLGFGVGSAFDGPVHGGGMAADGYKRPPMPLPREEESGSSDGDAEPAAGSPSDRPLNALDAINAGYDDYVVKKLAELLRKFRDVSEGLILYRNVITQLSWGIRRSPGAADAGQILLLLKKVTGAYAEARDAAMARLGMPQP